MQYFFLSLIIFLHVLIPEIFAAVMDGFVSAPWGKIQGIPKTTSSGHSFTSFEGIPYAKPPLGNLRFSKPVPSTGSNTTILTAYNVRPSCLMSNLTKESEDCLYIDLYVPNVLPFSAAPLAVMIFIHGGGFIGYPGNLNPEFLLEKNVIVALVHYRLGAMGFLSTGDDVLKGNYGLWDQQLAIKWVKGNVAAFGGDPDFITLFGESAGAASVAYQLMAPMAKDLFKRAILQSGTSTSSWALSRQPSIFAHSLGVRLGCVLGSSSEYLATCLRKIDGIRLQKEMIALWRDTPTFQHMADFMFVPVVDHDFVKEEPMRLIKDIDYLRDVGVFEKDIIVGVLNYEASMVTLNKDSSLPDAPNFNDYFANDIIPHMLYQRFGATSSEAMKTVEQFYRGSIPTTLLNKFMVSDAFADTEFVIPALEFVGALSETTKATVTGYRYFYYFDYCPSFFPKVCMGHGFDISFIFKFNVNFSSVDQKLSETFLSLLTTFAKTGVPTSAYTPQWLQYTSASKSYLRISAQSKIEQNLFTDRVRLWTETLPVLLSKSSVPSFIIG